MDDISKIIESFKRLGDHGLVARELSIAPGIAYKAIRTWQREQLIKGEVPEGYAVSEYVTRSDINAIITGRTQRAKKGGGQLENFKRVPNPRTVKFTTTVVNSEQLVERQWFREEADKVEKELLWKTYAEELLVPVKFLRKEIIRVHAKYEDLLALYPIGDYHTGMMAWALETLSDNFDSKISEKLLPEATAHLLSGAPPSKQCVLAFMGDFTHYDGLRPETPRHKHILDTDSRFFKVGRLSIRIVRQIISAARQRHEKVHVIFLPGNHDESVAELINAFLIEFYADDPNVTIDPSPSVFRYFEWNNNLFGFHHGDKTRPERMPMVMANDMREPWGRCENRYIFTGHVHHKSMAKDESGVSRETVPVLIPNDAHAATHGYRNARQMQVIIYDRIFGEEQRHTFNAERFFKPHRRKTNERSS